MSSRPQTVSEVLCREVGAKHPDGALQQIRMMKRVLRSHYRIQKQLERYDIHGLGDAVNHVAALRTRVESLVERQKKQARANVAAADEALHALDNARARLRAKAKSADEIDDVPAPTSDLAIVDAVQAQLDELRLELWMERDEEATDAHTDAYGDAPAGTDASDPLAQLAERMRSTKEEKEAVQEENDHLREQVTSLTQENHELQSRNTSLRRRLRSHRMRLQALTDRFCDFDAVEVQQEAQEPA
mgnify:FL=1